MILRDGYHRTNANTQVSWEMPDLIVSTVSTAVEFSQPAFDCEEEWVFESVSGLLYFQISRISPHSLLSFPLHVVNPLLNSAEQLLQCCLTAQFCRLTG